MEIVKKHTMDAWKAALEAILQRGRDFTDRESRVCREMLNLMLVISDPKKDIDEPIKHMQQSDQWVYPSKGELSSIMLEKEKPGIYEYTYGPRIFHYQQVKDQLNEFILPLLQQDPHSRRASIVLYDPVKDSRFDNPNIPSLILLQFKVIGQALHVTCFIRSNDFFIGWPANVYQIYCLQEFVAEHLQLGIGSITTFSGSAHLFQEHQDAVTHLLK